MKRELVKYPAVVLHTKAKQVFEVTGYIRDLLDDMAQTMYAEDGVGLAAPQIGVSLRLAVIDITGTDYDTGLGLIKMVNPEITAQEGEIDWEEGCLSIPEFRKKIKRSNRVTVSYLDENGNKKELKAEGLLAVAIQQEIDHLDGKLIIDSESPLKQDIYLKKQRKKQS